MHKILVNYLTIKMVLKELTETKQNQQPVKKQVKVTQPKANNKPQLKAKQPPVKKFETVERKAIARSKEDLKIKGRKMNIDFAKKGLPYKTQIKTINGKQYIQIVDLPLQNGMSPIKSKQ